MNYPRLKARASNYGSSRSIMAERAFELLRLVVASRGHTVLLVEQQVAHGLDTAHRACFVDRGRIAKTGTGAALLQNSDVQRAYTGL